MVEWQQLQANYEKVVEKEAFHKIEEAAVQEEAFEAISKFRKTLQGAQSMSLMEEIDKFIVHERVAKTVD